MYKFAISGKAGSGKDTVSSFILDKICADKKNKHIIPVGSINKLALADPIKEMILLMFPQAKKECLYGDSHKRNETIPGAFKDGAPLTYRQLLIDIGTGLGRGYNQNIWLENLDVRIAKLNKKKHKPDAIIVSDIRFKNEFDHIKNNGFCMIRLLREDSSKIDHVSETQQEEILDTDFDFVLKNNSSLEDLKNKVFSIVDKIKQE